MIKVFIDASVLFAAVYSLTGGSALVIELGKQNKARLFSSRLAVKEAERNLREKAGESELDRFYRIFDEVDVLLIDAPRNSSKLKYGDLVGEKDAPILASAIQSKAKFLVTLDRKHLLNKKIKEAKLAVNVVTPGEFIENI